MGRVNVNLRKVLKEKDITQKELAQKTGIHESVISGIVRDSKDTINRNHLYKIMKALDIRSFDEILELE